MIDHIRKDRKASVDDNFLERELVHKNSFSDIKEILDEALETLPEIQKAVILLRDYEGYSYKEIGDIVELNESQVKVYIYRARVSLKRYIGSLDMVI
jgi:RNA polymerase sigma-70 factor (ECF subfamily)